MDPHRFTYRDQNNQSFKEEYPLRVGGFSRFSKGVLLSFKLEIAVKKISHESQQHMKEFVAEIMSMSRLRHHNLAQLLGYYQHQGVLLFVYVFMPNGSLDKVLFRQRKGFRSSKV